MLPQIILDASSFWIINWSESADLAAARVDSSRSWLSLKSLPPAIVDPSAIQYLGELGFFPTIQYFESALRDVGLSGVISPQDLAGLVLRCLSTLTMPEGALLVAELLAEGTSTTPDYLEELSVDLKRASLKTAELAAINSLVGRERGDTYLLGSVASVDDSVEALVRFTCIAVPIATLAHLESTFIEEPVTVLRAPDSYWATIDLLRVWRATLTERDAWVAINEQAQRLRRLNGTQIVPFSVGSEFLQSVRDHDCHVGHHSSDVFRKCAEIIAALPIVNADVFRVSEKARSPARRRTRDGATAMRVHVSRAHEALRLMYWLLPDGSVELATLGSKAELFIAEGGGSFGPFL